jgi:MoaA/NifB/PqqE/SkfB family radical SAM enzyme
MKPWNQLKQDILKYSNLSKTAKNNWRFRYLQIKNDFHKLSNKSLLKIANKDSDERVRNIALDRLRLIEKYTIRKDFNNVVTIKLIVPTRCNASCDFCYDHTIDNDKELFLYNLNGSIEKIVSSISPHFPISLDITGGEPTSDIMFLKKIIKKLKSHPSITKFCRITLNTNGHNLKQVIPDLKGLVNYVNISTHHFDKIMRDNIFLINSKTTKFYKDVVLQLMDINIDMSTICVIHKDIKNFNNFNNNYVEWCKDVGFVSLRYRKNAFDNNVPFEEYMNEIINSQEYHLIQLEDSNDSRWCRLSDNDGFFVFFLNGVLNTYEVSKGIEYIIHDNGLLYLDYNKNVRFKDYDLPHNLILDVKQ